MWFHLSERKIGSHGASLSGRNSPSASARMPAFGMWVLWVALFAVIVIIGSAGAQAEAKEKIRLGAVENVVLLPWGVLMPARIDTGAATSSLDARNLVIKGKMVEFNLPQQYGRRRILLPMYKWKTIKTAERWSAGRSSSSSSASDRGAFGRM